MPNPGMMGNPMMGNPMMGNPMMGNPMMQNMQQMQQNQNNQMGGPVVKDIAWLKNNIDEFEKMPTNEQKTLLGTLMYSQVIKYAPPEHVPKITGMLIDLEVLSVVEVADILSDQVVLKERIDEATKIIEEDMGQN